jgi:hypothetical protein
VEYGHGIHFRLLAAFLHAARVIREYLLPRLALCFLGALKFGLFWWSLSLVWLSSCSAVPLQKSTKNAQKAQKVTVVRSDGVESAAGEGTEGLSRVAVWCRVRNRPL